MAIALTDVGNGTVAQLFSTINGNNDIIEGAINTPIGTTQIANGAVTSAKINIDSFKQMLLTYCYPVGSYYWSANDISPESFLGGSWTRVKGAFLFSVDPDSPDNKYNAAGQTGGSKDLQEHSHSISNLTNNTTTVSYFKFQNNPGDGYAQVSKAPADSATETATAGTGDAGNMPPYITAYCWRRTA